MQPVRPGKRHTQRTHKHAAQRKVIRIKDRHSLERIKIRYLGAKTSNKRKRKRKNDQALSRELQKHTISPPLAKLRRPRPRRDIRRGTTIRETVKRRIVRLGQLARESHTLVRRIERFDVRVPAEALRQRGRGGGGVAFLERGAGRVEGGFCGLGNAQGDAEAGVDVHDVAVGGAAVAGGEDAGGGFVVRELVDAEFVGGGVGRGAFGGCGVEAKVVVVVVGWGRYGG